MFNFFLAGEQASSRYHNIPKSLVFTLEAPHTINTAALLGIDSRSCLADTLHFSSSNSSYILCDNTLNNHDSSVMAPFQPYTTKPSTDFFTNYETEINRRECRRVVPMKVLALGLGRTGTASLRTALVELGFSDCYHMMSASVENPPDCLMWSDALAAKYDGVGTFGREQWDQLFGHCQAICDWPCVAFAKELIEAYPEAKVLVTTREVNSWHASTMKTVHWRATEPELKLAAAMGDWAAGMYQPMISSML